MDLFHWAAWIVMVVMMAPVTFFTVAAIFYESRSFCGDFGNWEKILVLACVFVVSSWGVLFNCLPWR